VTPSSLHRSPTLVSRLAMAACASRSLAGVIVKGRPPLWISGAVRIAQARDEYDQEVVPDDLVQVVQHARQPVHPLHNLLHDVIELFDPGNQLPAAGSSGTPSQGILIPVESDPQPSADVGERIFKAIKSAHKTASYARTELRTRVWETHLPGLAKVVDDCRSASVGAWWPDASDTLACSPERRVGSPSGPMTSIPSSLRSP
jgi:hypothetical protein